MKYDLGISESDKAIMEFNFILSDLVELGVNPAELFKFNITPARLIGLRNGLKRMTEELAANVEKEMSS